MFEAFQRFFDAQLSLITREASDRSDEERGYELATAVLLTEMIRTDFEVKESERAAVVDAMRRAFGLDLAEVERLVSLAETEAERATCLYQFTSSINERLSREQKLHVIELLWKVAFADGELDKYEDHFVRRIAELLYIKHSGFMQAKHRAMSGAR